MGVDAVPVSYIAILVDTTGAGFPHRGTVFPPSCHRSHAKVTPQRVNGNRSGGDRGE
ncbi:MAG: hypothetical protein QOI25_1945, partial [Mycobacterium sp.]|nr:hypothetical protein [Mycobacterium sp.]